MAMLIGGLGALGSAGMGMYSNWQAYNQNKQNFNQNQWLQQYIMNQAQGGALPGGQDVAQQYLSGLNNMSPNIYSALTPAMMGVRQNYMGASQDWMNDVKSWFNNPFAGGLIAGAEKGAGAANTVGDAMLASGGKMIHEGQSLYPYVNRIMQSGFDPQSKLYDRTRQQLTDQTRAGLEARGIDMGGAGAGLEGQALSNFNINWQNNLLQREATAAGAAGRLYGDARSGVEAGIGLEKGAPGMYALAGELPYAAQNQIWGDQFKNIQEQEGLFKGQTGMLGTMGDWGKAAQGQDIAALGPMLQYLQAYHQANPASTMLEAGRFGQQGQQNQWSNNNNVWQGFGSSMQGFSNPMMWAGLSKLFNSGGTGWGIPTMGQGGYGPNMPSSYNY